MILTELNILSSLCYYDPRNPNYDKENGDKKENCACDNCFYNRTPLAEQLVNAMELIRYSKLLLIQVKQDEIEIFPAEINTPDYLQQIETAINNIKIKFNYEQ
jgi:hypothetical protein